MTYNEEQDFHIFCDASETGFGGHLTTGSEDEPLEIYGTWSIEERRKSSTWRELEAVKRVIQNVITHVSGKKIRVYTDNKNVPQILKVGSRKQILHDNVMVIHDICNRNSITLSCVWIPRENNTRADTLSRKTDCDDWEIHEWIFQYLNNKWGPHTSDRFATDYNTKCDHFNSKFWCNGSSGVDTFSQTWYGYNNWLVSPPRLIPQTLNKLKNEKSKGTLLVPEWTSAPFWPMLLRNEGNFNDFVSEYEYFQGNLTKRGRGQNGIFGEGFLKFRILALRIRF